MTDDIAPASSRWRGMLGARGARWAVAAALVHAALVTFVALRTLQQFPNSGDEYAYLLGAELFAEGRLSVASPAARAFFDVSHVVNDGRFYGKYPPGWPAFLMLGVLVGAPWLVNLALGVASIVLMFVLARRHFGAAAANATMVLSAACPFLVFNAASLFSHPLCAVALMTFALAVLPDARRTAGPWTFRVAGASFAVAFATRPFTAVVVATILGAGALWATGRGARAAFLRSAALHAAPVAAVGLALFFAYNRAQTGSPLVQPFELYDPEDRLGFHRGPRTPAERIGTHLLDRIGHLVSWMVGVPLLAVMGFLRRGAAAARVSIVLAAVPLALLGGFFLYWGDGWFQYGPRYLYEAAFAILLLGGVALARVGDRRPAVVAAVLAAVVIGGAAKNVQAHRFYAGQVAERLALRDAVSAHALRHAVVIVRTGAGTMPARDLPRNGIRFDGDVLFVTDRGPRNAALADAFPGREAYVFTYDPQRRRGRLDRYDERTDGGVAARSDIRAFNLHLRAAPRFLW